MCASVTMRDIECVCVCVLLYNYVCLCNWISREAGNFLSVCAHLTCILCLCAMFNTFCMAHNNLLDYSICVEDAWEFFVCSWLYMCILFLSFADSHPDCIHLLIIWVFLCVCAHVRVYNCAQSCLTVCNPMDCSPPGSSVYEIFQGKKVFSTFQI